MSKLLETNYPNKLSFRAKCLVENTEYNEFKTRIETQILKNVELAGFRKGHVPAELARKKTDPVKLQETVFEETIQKFLPDFSKEVDAIMKKDDRVIDKVSLAEGEKIEETADGLVFTLEYNLLSNVDLEAIKNLEISKPNPAELPNYISFEDFKAKEVARLIAVYNTYENDETGKIASNSQVVLDITEKPQTQPDSQNEIKNENTDVKFIMGVNQFPPDFEKNLLGLKPGENKKFSLELTAKGDEKIAYDFEVKIKSILKPTLESLEAVFKDSQEAVKNFKDQQTFENLIEKTWKNQIKKLEDEAIRAVVVEKLVSATPDLYLDDERADRQASKIFGNLEKNALATKKSVLEIYNQSGLPIDGKMDEKSVKDGVKSYVTNELKLLAILEFVFFTQVNREKIPQLLDQIKKEIKANPTQYGLEEYDHENDDGSKHTHPTSKEIKVAAYDILVRQVSYTWIVANIKSLQNIDQSVDTTKNSKTETVDKKSKK